jgi:uncharacterized membrane protein
MTFLLWACRAMHLFGVIVWLGGLMFQSAVLGPIAHSEGERGNRVDRETARRFAGFIWMSAWTIAVTGLIMMLLNPKFLWWTYQDRWSILLAWKQGVFLMMMFYAFGYARMVRYLVAPSSNGGIDPQAALYRGRVQQFRAILIVLGILALLLGAAMVTYG